jgi:hypothetical protein
MFKFIIIANIGYIFFKILARPGFAFPILAIVSFLASTEVNLRAGAGLDVAGEDNLANMAGILSPL